MASKSALSPSVVVQITLSSVNCLALSKFDGFHALRNMTLLQSFGVLYAFKN